MLHLFFLLKQLDSVLEPFLEKHQVRCLWFLSGLTGFPLGVHIHLQKPQYPESGWVKVPKHAVTILRMKPLCGAI